MLLRASNNLQYRERHEVFSELTGGRPAVISGVTDGGPLGHPDPKDRVEQGGGRHPTSVTPRNGQAGSLGTEEKTLCPSVA
jgi:hypothetical protein